MLAISKKSPKQHILYCIQGFCSSLYFSILCSTCQRCASLNALQFCISSTVRKQPKQYWRSGSSLQIWTQGLGAGWGNWTLDSWLEATCFTTKLTPHIPLVRLERFELPTSRIRNPVFYPVELQTHLKIWWTVGESNSYPRLAKPLCSHYHYQPILVCILFTAPPAKDVILICPVHDAHLYQDSYYLP